MVMSIRQRSSEVFVLNATAKSLAIRNKDRTHIVDSGASLRMMGISSLTPKEKRTIRKSSVISDIQSANSMTVSDKEIGIHLWVNLVEDSTRVGRHCSDLGYAFSWPSGGTSKLVKGKRVIECGIDNFIPMVAVTEQRAVLIKDISLAARNCEHERERKDIMLELVKPFTNRLKDYAQYSHLPAGGNSMRGAEAHSKDARSR